ncbi:MAG TPA: CPBP family intramembrane metalloprotease [bacterium]|nr:CPBP family intramembrane metalloprotease [bacterium]
MNPDHRVRLWISLLLAMTVPMAGSLFYFVILAGTPLGKVLFLITKLFLVFWPIAAIALTTGFHRTGLAFDWRKHFHALPLGGLSGLLIAGSVFLLYLFTPLGDYVRLHADTIHAKVEEIGVLEHYILFGIFVSMIHSFLEEYYWRWFVFGSLDRLVKPLPAYFLANLAFAAHHYVILGCYFSFWGAFFFGTCVGLGGALWCWMYRKQNSLAGIWLSHTLVDLAIFSIGYNLIFG